jgi:nicotinamidase-related amidase
MQVKYPIIPEKTAMIVVDMQNDFVQEGAPIEIPRARAMVPRLNRLLNVCRAHQIPVIYIHHVIRRGRHRCRTPRRPPRSDPEQPRHHCRHPACGDLR